MIEGCGANGCEYMTGGEAVILGTVGANFGAGMTGGMAWVLDADGRFAERLNGESVVAAPVESAFWEGRLRTLVQAHADETASPLARELLSDWARALPRFLQIVPKEMLGRLDQPLRVVA